MKNTLRPNNKHNFNFRFFNQVLKALILLAIVSHFVCVWFSVPLAIISFLWRTPMLVKDYKLRPVLNTAAAFEQGVRRRLDRATPPVTGFRSVTRNYSMSRATILKMSANSAKGEERVSQDDRGTAPIKSPFTTNKGRVQKLSLIHI